MKIILTFIILSATCYAQTITVDPNSIVEADRFVTVNMKLTITAEQYEAMRYRETTFQQMIDRARIPTLFTKLVDLVKRILTRNATIAELKELER